MTALLEVRDLHVGYGKAEALRGITFEVGAGEIVVLLGANGAGKSTTLRAVSGLLRPWSGGVRLDGEEVGRQPAHRLVHRGIAHVAEGRQIFPGLTVEKNLLLGGYSRPDRRKLRQELHEVYERWPVLGRRRNERAGALSGGQQQMLVIAQGLMARPRLLLIDEPSLGLAPTLVAEVFAAIAELRSSGLSVLLVEQLVQKALEIADRGYVLARGEIVGAGTASELRADPVVQQAYLGGSIDPATAERGTDQSTTDNKEQVT